MDRPPKINTYEFPPSWYVAPGVLTLSPEAAREGADFWRSLAQLDARAKWIVGFAWANGRTIRRSADAPIIDEGPGLDLAGFRDTEIPTKTVFAIGGVPVVFIIPPETVAASKSNTIAPARTNSGRASFALV